MTPGVLLVAALAVATAVWTAWVYRSRELPVPGRGRLAALRMGSIALVALLFLNPDLPVGTAAHTATVVDASPSTGVPTVDGRVPAESWTDLVPPDEARGLSVEASDSRLAPGIARAIESGAGTVRLLTDGRLADPVELRALVDRTTVALEVVDRGGPVRNVGLDAPAIEGEPRAGETVPIRVSGFVEGLAGETAVIALDRAGEVLAADTVTLPEDGPVTWSLDLPIPPGVRRLPLSGSVRVSGDAFAGDDRRSIVLDVDPERGNAVLVAWTPGWESRYLAATLAEVGGLPVRGFLRAGTTGEGGARFLRMGDAPGLVDATAVVRAAQDAAWTIEVGGRPPEDVLAADTALAALTEALAASPRRLLLPGPRPGGPGAGGEWYLSGDLPASPLTAEFAGVDLLGLPPLGEVRSVEPGPGELVPLQLQRNGTGAPTPALVLRERDGVRVAEAHATGFWRWALRPGAPRTLYRRLWGGVAGWMLAGDAGDGAAGIAPNAAVGDPADSVHWEAAPAAGARLEVVWRSEDAGGETPTGTRTDTLGVDALGRAASPPLEAGVWSWRATVLGGEADGRVRDGVVVRESWSGDLALRRDTTLAALAREAPAPSEAGRPLRTSPIPWLLLLGLLSAEWIARRRAGLR